MTSPDRFRQRYRKLIYQRNQLIADVAHWNRTHPKEEKLESDTAEIDGLLATLASQFDGATPAKPGKVANAK